MKKDDVVHKSKIQIQIGLNDERVPVDLRWESDDPQAEKGPQRAKGILLSMFDKTHLDTLKIDLWTKDMQVIEMDRFFYQTLRGLADTYFRATQNKELANEMQRFVQYFGEKTEIIPPAK